MQPSNKCWALQIFFQIQLLYTSVCKYQLKLIYALSASRLSVPGFLNTHIISPLNAELSENKQDAKLLWLITEGKRCRNSRKSEHSTTAHVGGFSSGKHQNQRREEQFIPSPGIFFTLPLNGAWFTSSLISVISKVKYNSHQGPNTTMTHKKKNPKTKKQKTQTNQNKKKTGRNYLDNKPYFRNLDHFGLLQREVLASSSLLSQALYGCCASSTSIMCWKWFLGINTLSLLPRNIPAMLSLTVLWETGFSVE